MEILSVEVAYSIVKLVSLRFVSTQTSEIVRKFPRDVFSELQVYFGGGQKAVGKVIEDLWHAFYFRTTAATEERAKIGEVVRIRKD